jgi:hypothetical protein
MERSLATVAATPVAATAAMNHSVDHAVMLSAKAFCKFVF